jgi:hypothetical protein
MSNIVRILFLDSLDVTLQASIIGQKPKAKKAEVWRPLRDRVNLQPIFQLFETFPAAFHPA